jgi:Rieske Fe-S protein
LLLLAAPLWAFVDALAGWRRGLRLETRVTVPRPRADGVQFYGEVIVVRQGDELRAFWSKCPHLGCRIRGASEGALVCPCHGSRFDARGVRLSGPATKDLWPLAIEPGPSAETVHVVVPG